MKGYARRSLFAAACVTVASLLQSGHFIFWPGLKPNLSLVVLITLSFFFSDWITYLLLTLLAGLWLRFSLTADRSLLVFLAIAIFVFVVRRYLPARPIINHVILIISGTIGFYLLAGFSFLYHYPLFALAELSYNVILGMGFFALFKKVLGDEKRTATSI